MIVPYDVVFGFVLAYLRQSNRNRFARRLAGARISSSRTIHHLQPPGQFVAMHNGIRLRAALKQISARASDFELAFLRI
jgi:hypothetical protein